MASIITSTSRQRPDHFEPEASLEPHEQRRLRGHLEQIDFAAFAANREVLSKTFGQTNLATFQRLAVSAAQARAQWVFAAVAIAKLDHTPNAEQVARLTALRHSFEELTEAYEALRRMVERGYLPYQSKS